MLRGNFTDNCAGKCKNRNIRPKGVSNYRDKQVVKRIENKILVTKLSKDHSIVNIAIKISDENLSGLMDFVSKGC